MIYAEVIGDPIAQSKSPAIHNFWLGKLGIDAEYRAHLVTAGGLADYVARRRDDPDWRGCNVTMPHKQAIVPLLSRLELGAELVGAVNTIIPRRNGMLIGSNTDGAGFLEPLRPYLSGASARTALVVGSGGAARAIVAALAEEGFAIVLAARDPAKGRALLDEIDAEGEHQAIPLAQAVPNGSIALVVNASSLGMAAQPPLALDLSELGPDTLVYDIVTHPLETPLLQRARDAGLRTIDGLAMLIGQAAVAFGKFFRQPAPREHDAELRALLTS